MLTPKAILALLILGLVLGCSAAAASDAGVDAGDSPNDTGSALTPTDVAVLFPLPSSVAASRLMTSTSSGAKGVLLPGWATDVIDNLTSGLTAAGAPQSNAQLWPLLRVVSLNVDHCFPDGTVADSQPDQCRHQIRLVFQPLIDIAGGTSTYDVTVHAFYDLSTVDFTNLVAALAALKASRPAAYEAVGINPAMAAEGPGGAYADSLQSLVLQHCGAATLTKITFSALEGSGFGWHFGGYDFLNRTASEILIPATDYRDGSKKVRQELVNNPADLANFNATVDPPTTFSLALGVFLDSNVALDAGLAGVASGVRASLQIDNPATSNNPNTVDCASCHLATPVRNWAARRLGFDAGSLADGYRSHWNLTLQSETQGQPQATRCFGYFGNQVSISQRTVNEAAAVVDYLNSHYLDGGRQ